VLHLHYYEDLKIKEVAKLLGLKESAVKMQLTRGRKLLQEELEKEDGYVEGRIQESLEKRRTQEKTSGRTDGKTDK